MMKKTLALLLTGCMLLQTGCGSKKMDEPEPEKEAVMQEIPSEGEASEEKVKLSSAPKISFTEESMDVYSEDGKSWLIHADYQIPEVMGDGYEALAEGIRAWSEENVQNLQKTIETYTADAESMAMQSDTGVASYAYSLSERLIPMRTDASIVSFLKESYSYMGGAHGNSWYEGFNFDAQTGEVLELSDVVTKADDFRKEAIAYILEYLEASYSDGLFSDYAESVERIWDYGPTWYLDASGMTIVFNPYDVGPYAMGTVKIVLPKDLFGAFLKEEYMSLGMSGYAYVPENVEMSLGLPLSSSMENVFCLQSVYNEEYGMNEVSVHLNDRVLETGLFGRVGKAYLINDGMFSFLLMDADYASDDYVTVVYNVSTGAISETDRMEGTSIRETALGAECFELSTRLDVLGTYGGIRTYSIDGKSGRLQTGDVYYQIRGNNSPLHALITVQELPVVSDGIRSMLPIGSRIRMTGTDNEGIAVFENLDTGETGEIHYVRGDGAEDTWTIHIDGIPEQEYFEEYLPYAG